MKTGIFLIIDENNSHCGLTDRLKTAVGLCYLAQENDLDFRMIHRAGFDLRDYLVPNQIVWSCELSDLCPIAGVTEYFRYQYPYTDLPAFQRDRLYICREYIGNNILEKRNIPGWENIWRQLFFRMFTPTAPVREALTADLLPERFTAVVVRFINSLDYSEDSDYNRPFSADMQKKLTDAVLSRVAECARKSAFPVVVYSDSPRFLAAAAAEGFLTTDPSGVGNIMNQNAGNHVILRNFVNLFQMARAEAIYSILHVDGFPETSLYKTQYPRYAAIIGGRPFVRL